MKIPYPYMLVAALLCLPAAAAAQTGRDAAVATVNGKALARPLFEQLVKSHTDSANPFDLPGKKNEAAPAVDRKALLDDLIVMELLAQAARQRGIHLRPEILAEAELQFKTLLERQLVRDWIAETRVTDAELRRRYEAQPAEMQYRVSHILLDSEAAARTALAELGRGASFQSVARRHSRDVHSRKDGMLGWMMANQLVSPFLEAVKMLKPGSRTEIPVATEYGWHVIRLHEVRPLPRPEFELARTWLHSELMHEKVQARVQQLKQSARIERAAGVD